MPISAMHAHYHATTTGSQGVASAHNKATGEGAEWIRTCTIITGEPNELVAPIHNRMAVILPSEAWNARLGETVANADELRALLKPFPAECMRAYLFGTNVNSVKAGLIEPMMASGGVRI
jgi:putative SOS response-associated peptidase YedK